MIYGVEFLARARKELLDAFDWYEDKQPKLGDRFVNEVEKVVKQIEQTPDRFPERQKKFREARIRVFPYLIIYRINTQKKSVAISAVFHTSRNPGKKPSKLRKT